MATGNEAWETCYGDASMVGPLRVLTSRHNIGAFGALSSHIPSMSDAKQQISIKAPDMKKAFIKCRA
ncbi:hypothetical protein RvY_00567 [Ramazzottius varieornatus]|uniref:Uncharacterized protein n=1 Tax=Ramazzottius varieornatus TaxID=947166 RepID=A0A1D1UDP4_RAMVA|nr:hypothetical protein RvY_00567 [Ramazzottius varieornatus]